MDQFRKKMQGNIHIFRTDRSEASFCLVFVVNLNNMWTDLNIVK